MSSSCALQMVAFQTESSDMTIWVPPDFGISRQATVSRASRVRVSRWHAPPRDSNP
ncbi:hypothetical protein M5X00_13095 [Paenibacillus alvei]|uniref:hypothetical protein n=1 Tax=Paenibacillus alvei TaxID=44250 RepID=UPI0022822ADF|nr:hypothetical protein [Paenibacillus alvei]MCY9708257.1 hypothetical protein [Paenibacillus alvei]MCY9755177.1 hypothetical protein [Paenibacillus alvei]